MGAMLLTILWRSLCLGLVSSVDRTQTRLLMPSSSILQLNALCKTYPGPPSVEAVRGISLSIREGVCLGLLGPNGAGKTTTIEMLEGILPPTSGQVLFKGKPIGRDFRDRTGIQFQQTQLPDFLRVGETLEMFAKLYERTMDRQEIIRLCALEDILNRDTHRLSGGQKQRVLLALALVNDPDILFLDEPTTGLDPQARRGFWDLIQAIKKRGKTVVLTTHYMDEAYILCDEIAIVDHGKIIAQGSPDQLLKEHFQGMVLELPNHEVPEHSPLRQDHPGVFTPLSRSHENPESEGHLVLHALDVRKTLETLLTSGVALQKLSVRPRTLDDLFLTLTGKRERS